MSKTALFEQARAYLEDEEYDETLLSLELDRWAAAAAGYLRLYPGEALPPATQAQVVRNAAASTRAGGDEGLTGSSAGGQSYTYEDLLAQLERVACRERRPRF